MIHTVRTRLLDAERRALCKTSNAVQPLFGPRASFAHAEHSVKFLCKATTFDLNCLITPTDFLNPCSRAFPVLPLRKSLSDLRWTSGKSFWPNTLFANRNWLFWNSGKILQILSIFVKFHRIRPDSPPNSTTGIQSLSHFCDSSAWPSLLSNSSSSSI